MKKNKQIINITRGVLLLSTLVIGGCGKNPSNEENITITPTTLASTEVQVTLMPEVSVVASNTPIPTLTPTPTLIPTPTLTRREQFISYPL